MLLLLSLRVWMSLPPCLLLVLLLTLLLLCQLWPLLLLVLRCCCRRWGLAAGLFGFAGGITNWLAVKMLFDRVCGLPGSGVIPMRFKEIREVVKDTIMKTFFDGPYLENYMSSKGSEMLSGMDLGAKLRAVLETPEVDEMISNQLEGLAAKPEGKPTLPQICGRAGEAWAREPPMRAGMYSPSSGSPRPGRT